MLSDLRNIKNKNKENKSLIIKFLIEIIIDFFEKTEIVKDEQIFQNTIINI